VSYDPGPAGALSTALDDAALTILAAVVADRQDVGAFVARALARLAARLGSSAAVLANRPGSWEAAAIDALLAGTVGEGDEHLGAFGETTPGATLGPQWHAANEPDPGEYLP
jgi:hypothetical protein